MNEQSYWYCERTVAPPLGVNGEPMWLVWAAEGEDYPVLIGQFCRYEDAERIVALHNAGRVKPTLPADDGADTRPIPF